MNLSDAGSLRNDPILPPPPAEAMPILHDREYRVRALRLDAERIVIQGAVRDQKPPGMFLADDTEPMTIHHMTVSLEVSFPALEILDAEVHLEVHPHDECPRIEQHYQALIGLSLTRGYTHKVRELFGGPNGCAHTTALLTAMAPVGVQSLFAMHLAEAVLKGEPHPAFEGADDSGPRASGAFGAIANTCHVMAGDPASRFAGKVGEQRLPIPVRRRLAERRGETP